MAAKRKFVFNEQHAKAFKISIRNKTLGKRMSLTKEQVLSMAERGMLDEKQINAIFEPASKSPKKDKEA